MTGFEGAHRADRGDLAVLRTLWRTAVDEVRPHRGGALLVGDPGQDLDGVIGRYLDDPDRLAVLGLIDGVPLGLAAARCVRGRGDPLGVVDLIYVDAAAREVGIGEAMLDQVVAWCADRGCVGVDAPALPGSRRAKAFFEDQGFVARLLIMHHPLGSPEPR